MLELERRVQQAQKLESIGVLAGGIVHDFNNYLTAILGNISLALSELPPDSASRAVLEDAVAAARRAAEVARQMLAYSGKGPFLVRSLDLGELVEEMIPILRVSVSKKAGLRFQFQKGLPAIEADETQVRQVVMNLLINASEAIGEKTGDIAVSTFVRECDRAFLAEPWNDAALAEGRYVGLEVEDTGSGIPADRIPRIFDPFFTTKPAGRGLGLATVLGIVRNHEGTIKIKSLVGKGTSFTVLFPAGTSPAEKAGKEEADAGWRGSGLVLLADDDQSVLSLGKRILEKLGFEVLTACDGRQALEAFHEHRGSLSCVLLDLSMPQMDGGEVFQAVRLLCPDMNVILSSGYDEGEVARRFEGKGLAGFVQKPYTLDNMREVLRRVVSRAKRWQGAAGPGSP